MIVSIVEILSLSFEKVRYYSAVLGDRSLDEFRDFQLRLGREPDNRAELAEINRYIQQIGEVTGAFPGQFRNEGAADGLPPPYHHFLPSGDLNDYGLRLYCIRLSPYVVILLNGDRKTALKVQDCPQCYPHFDRARKLAVKIDKAIVEGNIELDEKTRELIVWDDFELTI